MQNPFLYPGRGLHLKQDTNGDGTPDDTTAYEIDSGSQTEAVGAHDCKEIMFEIDTDGVVSGDIEVWLRGASNSTSLFDTIPNDGTKSNFLWNAGEALVGHFFIKNTTDSSFLDVYCQKKI